MTKAKKIALFAAVAVIGVLASVYAGVWLLGERIIARHYETPPIDIAASSDPAIIAEGERLAAVAGCSGCHTENLNGKLFAEAPHIFRSVTANIPRLAPSYSDEDFARAIRHGVKKNGRSVIGMPSPSFYNMRDEDLSAIISFIRTQTDRGEKLPKNATWILGRLELIQGLYPPEASTIDHNAPRRVYDLADQTQRGEYLATIACSECHGLDFKGDPFSDAPGSSPDLMIAAAYAPQQFAHLMRTGEPVDGRDLRLMSGVARDRFSRFTDEEVAALHAYFVARADAM